MLTGSRARLLAGLAISAGCLILAFRSVPLEELGQALTQGNYWWLTLAVTAQFIGLLARARRWQVLLAERAGFWELFWAQVVGFLGNNILPLRAGEAARVMLVRQRTGLPIVQVATSVIVERALDVLSVLLLLLSLFPLVKVPSGIATAAVVLAGGLALAVVVLIVLSAWGNALEAAVAAVLVNRSPRLRTLVTGRVAELQSGLAPLRLPRAAGEAAVWSAAAWAASIGTAWAVIQALVPGDGWVEAAFMIAVVAIGISAPSSPGFIGVFQFVGQQALVLPFPERYSPASALSVALLTHLVYYVITNVLGMVGLSRAGISLANLRGATPP